MAFNVQPTLENDDILLRPLAEDDFAALYAVAADPKVWEQHPNKDRWKEEVFRNFFRGAMQSGGAFAIISKATGKIIGSTRFYEQDEQDNSVFIGYTFYGRESWGKGINPVVKQLMLDYAFRFVDKVYFHIGADNVRSQVAIGRLGAVKIMEESVAYVGEAPRLNYRYLLEKPAAKL
ncbi:GNAT family N-acetyltransferase [Chitinophaga lutea]